MAPAFGLNRLFKSPCLKAIRLPSDVARGVGGVTAACLLPRKLAMRLRSPRYPRYAAPTNFQTVKATTDSSRRAVMTSTDASAHMILPDLMPRVVKEAARL